MTCSPAIQQRKRKMFEFAAGHVQQEERERQIAEGLRRRELLAAPTVGRLQSIQEGRPATMPARAHTPARANAER
jgi:hypothetical protein